MLEVVLSWGEAGAGLEAGAPVMKDEAIWDQAVAASVIFAGSLVNLAICSCQRSKYRFANASKSGGDGFSLLTRGVSRVVLALRLCAIVHSNIALC